MTPRTPDQAPRIRDATSRPWRATERRARGSQSCWRRRGGSRCARVNCFHRRVRAQEELTQDRSGNKLKCSYLKIKILATSNKQIFSRTLADTEIVESLFSWEPRRHLRMDLSICDCSFQEASVMPLYDSDGPPFPTVHRNCSSNRRHPVVDTFVPHGSASES